MWINTHKQKTAKDCQLTAASKTQSTCCKSRHSAEERKKHILFTSPHLLSSSEVQEQLSATIRNQTGADHMLQHLSVSSETSSAEPHMDTCPPVLGFSTTQHEVLLQCAQASCRGGELLRELNMLTCWLPPAAFRSLLVTCH